MPPRSRHDAMLAGACAASLLLLVATTTSCRRRAPRRPEPPAYANTVVVQPPPTAEPPPPAQDDDSARLAQMSEPERKSAARAAFAEGVRLQQKSEWQAALVRFEAAQRLFDAPTHVLRIAQCQAQLGRLVEAHESYEAVVHVVLTPSSPAPFREAKESARAELARLEPRVPTLRVETNPPVSTLKNVVIEINGTAMPAELVGVARPLNPGRYRVTVTAAPNRSGAAEMALGEREAKTLEVRLSP